MVQSFKQLCIMPLWQGWTLHMEKLPRKCWLDHQGVEPLSLEKLGRPKQMQNIWDQWPYSLQRKLWLASCQIPGIRSCCIRLHFVAVGIFYWTWKWSWEHENIRHFPQAVLQAASDALQICFLLVHPNVLQQEGDQAQGEGGSGQSTGLAPLGVLEAKAQSPCRSSRPNPAIPETECATGNYFGQPQRRFIFGIFSCNLKLWSLKILHHSLHFVPGIRNQNLERPCSI